MACAWKCQLIVSMLERSAKATGKRQVTRSIPDRRTLLVDSLLLRPNKPGWL